MRRQRRWVLALIDYDNDGFIDVFAANDTQPNRLYRNKRRWHVRRRRRVRVAEVSV